MDPRRFLKGPLQNDHGALTPRRFSIHMPGVSITIPGQKEEQMNQKELVREMREMHVETLQQLKLLTEAVQKLALAGVATTDPRAILHRPSEATVVVPPVVVMDESIVVTDVKTDSLEKGFEEIASTTSTKDSGLKSGLSKLRRVKKGD